MNTKKPKLTAPKTARLYGYRKPGSDKLFETSSGTDATTTCTTVATSTHFNKV